MGIHKVKSEVRSQKPEVVRAVFVDRDGVINREIRRDNLPFAPDNLKDFQIYPEVPEACRRLKEAGFLLVVATNQPDVARGTMKLETVEAMHAQLRRELPLDAIEVCYHAGKGMDDCDCRKPKPGLLLNAARKYDLDLAQSWMVGDRWRDIDCGFAAGVKTVFIDRQYSEALKQKPDFSAGNLAEAADIILRETKKI